MGGQETKTLAQAKTEKEEPKINSRLSPEKIRSDGDMSGFDYEPPEKREFTNEMVRRFRLVAKSFGYGEVDAPLLQPMTFYEVKSGEEILQHTYTFTESDGNVLVLRPEITPSIAYMIARNDAQMAFPVRWWSNPTLFRKERAQKGRKRQFNQLNVDLFDRADSGRSRAFDDAEVISVAISIFKSFKLDHSDIVMRINSRSLVERMFDIMEFTQEQRSKLLSLIDRVGKIKTEEFEKQLTSIVQNEEQKGSVQQWLAIDTLDGIKSHPKFLSLDKTKEYLELVKVFDLLKAFGISEYCQFAPTIVRGLGYYTGTVFEAFDKERHITRSLMGGGRYDHLTKAMGGKRDVTGVGFGFGNVPLEELLSAKGMTKEILPTEPNVDYYLITISRDMVNKVIEIAQQLRALGKNVIIDSSISKPQPDQYKAQFQRASKLGVRNALIISPQSIGDDLVGIKDMQNQTQSEVSLDSLLTEAQPKSN